MLKYLSFQISAYDISILNNKVPLPPSVVNEDGYLDGRYFPPCIVFIPVFSFPAVTGLSGESFREFDRRRPEEIYAEPWITRCIFPGP